MDAEGRIGPRIASDGTRELLRLGRTSEVVTTSDIEDLSLRGEIFFASIAVAGVDHQASFTTTAPFALFNPQQSNVDLVILGVTMGYVSGTLGAGFLGLGQYLLSATNVIPTGTRIVARGSTRLGGANPVGEALETATLTAGATLVFPVTDIAPKLATTAINSDPGVIKLAFPVVVPPGVTAVLSGVAGAAGTTPRVTLGMIWKELKRLS